jgi:phosphoribosyl 1,2-cyclic phosphate phosphodiesterase
VISDARITVLGSGTSAGIPSIGCSCDACTSDDPRDVRTRTSAAVEWVDGDGCERLVLIDAGPDLRQQALRHGLRRCDAVFVTHQHTDHIFGIDELRRFNAVMEGNPPIDIYAEPRCWAALRRVYQHIFEKSKNDNHSFIADLVPHELAELPYEGGAGPSVDLWGMRFTPVRVLHGKLPILGYRVEPVAGAGDAGDAREGGEGGLFPLAWVTDTSSIPPKSWAALDGLGTLFLDGLRPRRHPTHFTLDEAQGAAGRIEASRTFLIHIAHEVVHARDEPGLDDGVRLAVDGLRLAHAAGGGVEACVEVGPGSVELYEWAAAGVRGAEVGFGGAGR